MSSSPTLPPQVSPPEFAVTASRPHALAGVDVIALPVLEGADGQAPVLGPGAVEVGELLGVDLLAVLDADRVSGKVGEVTVLPVPLGAPENAELRQVLLVGLGAASADDFRRAGATLARAVLDRAAVATTITAVEPSVGLEPFVVGTILGSFAFAWRKAPPEHVPVGRVVLAGLADADRPALERAVAVGGASWRARTLASVPSNLKNPAWLADQAVALAGEAGLEVTVWDEKRLADDGFGGILGVGQASETPPRLIRLDYTPAQKSGRASRGSHADGGAGRQGHHLRHRRPLDQVGRGDGQHEARHDGRRRRHVRHGGAGRRGLPGAGRGADPGGRERHRRQRAAPR